MTNKTIKIAYLPFAPIQEGFVLGSYEIWPFYKESKKKIENIWIVNHLEQVFSRYFNFKYAKDKGGYDKKIEEIFIISPVGFDFNEQLTDEQIEDIKRITHVIAFCAINDSVLISSSSDAYILHLYEFKIGSKNIQLWNTLYSNINMIKIMKPFIIDKSLLNFTITDLCQALGTALQHKNKPEIKRIFRSIELYFHSVTYGEMITDEHRILTLVMCFEVLLGFNGDKIKFAKKLDSCLNNYFSAFEERQNIKYKGAFKNFRFSITVWWAYDLYNLRSNIIHGKDIDWEVTKYGNVSDRIEFGGNLLRLLIKQVLIENHFLIEDPLDQVFGYEDLDEKLIKTVNLTTH